jgi:hypothetical protein
MKAERSNRYSNLVILKDRDFIPFEWISKKWGRAEFSICSQYKRGKLVRLFIYPHQQENEENYYMWEGAGRDYFTIQGYQGLADPKIWLINWCKEHKCQNLRLYVPPESKYIWFQVLFTINIGFTKTKW